MTVFNFDRTLYEASVDWIRRECIATASLADAIGITDDDFAELAAAGVVPVTTYSIYDRGIVSPVATLGEAGRLIDRFEGPAVVTWLRRAAVYQRDTGTARLRVALEEWLRRDFRDALLLQEAAASRFGWASLFDNGQLVASSFDRAAAQLWEEWLGGGWAVCLNCFSGYDVVTKDIELDRIPALACDGERIALVDAMLRYDSVVRVFAPFERPISSRYRVIDRIALEYGLPWPAPDELAKLQNLGVAVP